jgi:dTDP-4-dehydrorhamnose 3,5-epimerase
MENEVVPHARKDPATVTSDGARLDELIAGVIVRDAITHVDERGELCEIYDPRWGVTSAPLFYVYQAALRPGVVKGWVYHKGQEDRLFASLGHMKVVLYDQRTDSPTRGLVNEIYLSERRRRLLIIPRLVVHAVQNVGTVDAVFINMPTAPYIHDNPDKFRISLDSKEVPYSFAPKLGW